MRARYLIAAAIFTAVLTYLVFVPSRLHTKYFETAFNQTRLYCGGADVEVTTSQSGASKIVNYTQRNKDGEATERMVELFYSGSALFSDFYQAKTGEKAEYNPELQQYDFNGSVGGVCY